MTVKNGTFTAGKIVPHLEFSLGSQLFRETRLRLHFPLSKCYTKYYSSHSQEKLAILCKVNHSFLQHLIALREDFAIAVAAISKINFIKALEFLEIWTCLPFDLLVGKSVESHRVKNRWSQICIS